MSVKVETLEKNMVKLEVEVPAEEFEEAIQAAYDGMKSRIDIPGFRKGKAPRKLIEKMYGANFFYEDALDLLLPEAYADAVDEADLDVVSRPSVDLVQVEAGKPLIFTAEVAVRPEVKLGQYKGIEVPKADLEVTEEEVLAEIDKEREKDARQISVEDRPVENGDMIMLDFEGFVDGVAFDGGKGENYPLTIGSGAFIPGFEEQLVGKNIGEDVEVQVTFPEEYQAEELAGKAAVFKCKVNEIKVKELPELDDEFAQDVSQFDTLAEYKEDVKAKLAERKAKDAEAAKEDAVLMKIIENAEMEIPEPMLEMQIQQMMDNFKRSLEQQGLSLEQYLQFTGLTSEKMREQVRPNALLSIQSRLVLETIVEEEAIDVTEEEVDAEIREMAEQYKMDEKTLKDLLSGDDLMQLELDLTVKKAVKLVNEAAKEV